MGITGDSLEQAAAATFTRPTPATVSAQTRFSGSMTGAPPALSPKAWASSSGPSSATSRARSAGPAPTSAARLADEASRRVRVRPRAAVSRSRRAGQD